MNWNFLHGDVNLCYDSQFAIHLCRNFIFHERTKHVATELHFIRDIVSKCVSNEEASMTQYEVLIAQTITRLKLEERLAEKPSNFINW